MRYLGDFHASSIIRGLFNTRTAAGAPITLAGTPALSVYKANSTTESTAGVTLTVDFDSRTGLHFFAIDTSSDGAFYAAGEDYRVVVTAGTVDGVSVVGHVVAAFSLANRSALRPTTAGRTLDVSSNGEAGIDLANVGSPTTSLNLSGTTIATSQVVASVTGNVGGNVAGSVASVTAAVAVGSINANAVNASALATDAVNEIQSGLATAANLATVAGYLDTEVAAILAIASKLDTMLELDGAVYRLTVNALEQAPSGGGGGSTDWTADQRTAIATILGIPASGTTPEVPSAGALKVIDDFLDTEVAAIKAKTDLIPSDPADASDIAASFSTVNLTLATIAGYVDTEMGTANSGIADIQSRLPASLVSGRIDASVGAMAVNVVTASAVAADAINEIQSGLATSASITTLTNYVDTEVASIKTVTDKLNTAMVLDGAVYQFTANALELGPSGGGGGGSTINNYFTTATTIDSAPVAASGRLAYIIIGDDYLAANSRSFLWTVPAVSGFTVGSVVARFGASAVLACGTYSFVATGSATDNGDGTWEVSVDVLGTATADLVPGEYDWSMTLQFNGVNITKIQNTSPSQRVKVLASPS